MFDFLKNIKKEDAVLFGAGYVGSGLSILGATTIASYNFDPLKHVRSTKLFQRPFVQNTFHKIENWKWITAFTKTVSNHPQKLNRALVESLLITHLASPLTTPLQIAMAYHLVGYIKGSSIVSEPNDV